MKKIVSLLAVALFATTFAAGCGKHTECKQATSKEECKEDKFEKDKFKCEWKKDPADNKEKCMDKAPAYTVPQADTDACKNIATPADQAACDAATITQPTKDAGYKCKFVAATTTPVAAAKCELKN